MTIVIFYDIHPLMKDLKAPQRYAGKKQVVTYLEPSVAEGFKKIAASRQQSQAALLEQIVRFTVVKNEVSGEATPHYTEEKKRVKVYNCRLTEGEGMRLEAEARRHEMRASAFIRLILRGALTKTISLSVVDHDELQKMRSELSRIGTNLNQAVKLLKANPYGENPVTVELIQELYRTLDAEKRVLQAILLKNIQSWANLYE